MTNISSYREKKESELYEHLKKATNDEDVAPKQKHVRWCILYTWDHSTCKPFWDGIKGQPILSNGLMCFKALTVIHKLLVDGPHIVLSESLNEIDYLDSLCRQSQYSTNLHGRFRSYSVGYTALILPYVTYIKAKLAFHKLYPEFNGKFDSKDYISRKGDDRINHSYGMVLDLFDLLSHILSLQHQIGCSFRGSRDQTCLQGALIPLVEESDGIYKFATKMLEIMFPVLTPLRDRYIELFWKLRTFYFDCNTLRYLTSIILVPKLPERPPFFIENAGSTDRTSPSRSPTTYSSNNLLIPSSSGSSYIPLDSFQNGQQAGQNQMLYTRQQAIYNLENGMQNVSLNQEAEIDWKAKYEELLEKYNALIKLYQELQEELTQANEKISTLTDQIETFSEYEPMLIKLQKKIKDLVEKINTLEKEKKVLAAQRDIDVENQLSFQDHEAQLEKLKDSIHNQYQSLKEAYDSLNEKNQYNQQAILALLSHLFLLLENDLRRAHDNQQIVNSEVNWAFGISMLEQGMQFIDEVLPSLLESIDFIFASNSNPMETNSVFSIEDASATDVDFIKISRQFQTFASILENVITFLLQSLDVSDSILDHEQEISMMAISFFNFLRTGLDKQEFDQALITSEGSKLRLALDDASKYISEFQSTFASAPKLPFSNILQELADAAAQIDKIAAQLQKETKSIVIDSTLGVTDALSLLMKYATLCQEEILAHEKSAQNDPANFYLKNSKWTEGLISAARTVVTSMTFLGDASKSYSTGHGEVESVLVGAKEVAAGTIQLVTAARVKAIDRFSKNQVGLEDASKQVGAATSNLAAVAKKDYLQRFSLSGGMQEEITVSAEKMNPHQLNIAERNQQIEIMNIETKLSQARAKLALIRKHAYKPPE